MPCSVSAQAYTPCLSRKIDLNGLRGDAETYTFRLGDSYFESVAAPEVRRGDADVTLSVRKVQGSFFELSFHIEASVIVPCDRCLDDMRLPVSADGQLRARLGEENSVDDDLVVSMVSLNKGRKKFYFEMQDKPCPKVKFTGERMSYLVDEGKHMLHLYGVYGLLLRVFRRIRRIGFTEVDVAQKRY